VNTECYNQGMALFMKQEDGRSKLQQEIAAELQAKAKKRADEAAELPDGVDDSRFIEGTKRTTSLAWVWVLIFLAIAVVVIWLLTMGGQQ